MEPSTDKAILELLASVDPLSDEAMIHLLNHREEDQYVDYKLTMHNDERVWLEFTKDVMAFANTFGGYLVFGVEDSTFEVAGLSNEVVNLLTDVNNIRQKLNRYLEPEIAMIRSKPFLSDGKQVVVAHVPQSTNLTHVVAKDGAYRLAPTPKHQKGEPKIVLRKGTVYVRRSAGNHLVDSRDLDAIIERRVRAFRDALMGKIARVVDAPQETEVVLVSRDSTDPSAQRLVIQDAPDALAIKGISFSVTPDSPEEEVAGCIALAKSDPGNRPPAATIWNWYSQRSELGLSAEQELWLARFAFDVGAPVFYWLRRSHADDVKKMMLDVVSNRKPGASMENLVGVAAFMGAGFRRKIIERLGADAQKLSPKMRKLGSADARSLCGGGLVQGRRGGKFKNDESGFRSFLHDELSQLADKAKSHPSGNPGVMEKAKAFAFDCHLYARDDKYTKPLGEPAG